MDTIPSCTSFPRAAAVCTVLFAALLAGGCGGGDKKAGPIPSTVASWDEFTEGPAAANAGRRPVVFVGIDAGVWHVIDRLVEAGKLPNFARIKREGAWGPLQSVDPYVTPPAWTTMLTGYLPQHTGVYTFGAYDRETKTFGGVRSTDAQVPFVWEAAGRAGLRSAVVNVPMTYPVYPIDGIMVSGLLTPIETGDAPVFRPAADAPLEAAARRAVADAHARLEREPNPPGVSALADSLNAMVVLLHDTTDDGRRDYDTVTLHVYARDAAGNLLGQPAYYAFGLGEYSPWVSVRVRGDDGPRAAYTRVALDLAASDAGVEFSQVVFPIEATFTWPDSLAGELRAHFGFYLPTKMMDRDVVPALTRDNAGYASWFYDYDDWDFFSFVFTQTDNIHHKSGFDAKAESVYVEIDRCLGALMARMPADAVLVIASDHGFASYDTGIDLNAVFAQMHLMAWKGSEIDPERTLVFHNLWHLYINHDLVTREALAGRGYDVPASVDPLDYLRRLVTEACANLTVDGKRWPVTVEPMPADAIGDVPDMRVQGTYDNYMVEYWALQHPRNRIVYERTGEDRFWHARDGMFLMWGDGVKAGADLGVVGIENVAPTIAYFLGVPVSADMDGHILRDGLDDPAARAVVTVGDYRNIPRAAPEVSEKREALEKKLRSLGYIR